MMDELTLYLKNFTDKDDFLTYYVTMCSCNYGHRSFSNHSALTIGEIRWKELTENGAITIQF